MKIDLGKSVTVITVPQQTQTFSEVSLQRVIDFSEQKRVEAVIKETGQRLVLWEGPAYDTIGQWTDTDVTNRIKELLG